MSAAIHIDLDEDSAAPEGYVVIAVRGGEPASPSARFTLRRFGFSSDHLGPDGWVPGETPLTPERVVHTGDGARLFIAPSICHFINPDQLVEFGFLGDGVTCNGKAKLLWPDVPAPRVAAAMARPAAVAAPVTRPTADHDDDIRLDDDPPAGRPAARTSVLAASRATGPSSPSMTKIALISLAALIGAGIAGGGAWYFMGPGSGTTTGAATAAPPAVPAGKPSAPTGQTAASTASPGPAAAASASAVNTREQVAAFIKSQPPSVAAYVEAEKLMRAGTTDGAFLLYRYAADKGHTPSMIAIGKMYDPIVNDAAAQKFVRRSAETAVSWYRKAGVEPEAQWLMGRLMLKGGQDLPADKTAAKEALQKAAAAGNGEAKQLLQSVD